MFSQLSQLGVPQSSDCLCGAGYTPLEVKVKDTCRKPGKSKSSILESLGDWFQDEHVSQIGPLRDKTGTVAGMIIKRSVLFLLVLELWGYEYLGI